MTAPTVDRPQPPIPVDPAETQLPPIAKIYGEDYPAPGQPPQKAVAYVKRLIEQTNPLAHVLAKNAARNACYASGKQAITWNARRREYVELPLDEGEERPDMNHIRPILRSRTQRLLSSPVDFLIVPDSNAMEQRDRAKVGINFLRARYRQGGLYAILDTALEYAQYGGVAALKSFWNPSIGPLQDATLEVEEPVIGPDGLPVEDVNNPGFPAMEMSEKPITVAQGTGEIAFANPGETPARYHLGDTDTALRTIFQIRLNPEATGWRPADGCRWLLDLDEVPLSVARGRFPHLADKIGASNEVKPTSTTEKIAASAVIKNPATDLSNVASTLPTGAKPEPNVLIAEYWELPCPYYRAGRLIQIVGDQVAYDDAFPDGIFPYDPVYDEPAPGWWAGRACVNDMIGPQDVINRQWAAICEEMRDQGSGQFVTWDLPGVPNQLGREKRLIVKLPMRTAVGNRGVSDIFARIPHQAVGADRWRMIEAAQSALNDIGAYHEVTRGSTPPGIDSGVAIEHLLEQERGQLSKATHSLENTIVSWSRKQLKIGILRYKDVKRWIPVERPDMGYMAEGITGIDLPDPDTITIELENFRPRSQAAFTAQITDLMEKQIISPEKGLKMLDLGRGVEGVYSSQTRHYAKARQENLWIEKHIASFEVVGEQPVMAQITDPLTGETTEEETGVVEPVMKVVIPERAGEPKDASVPEPPPSEPTPDGNDPDAPLGRNEMGEAWVPLCLQLDDDHTVHLECLEEIILDYSKPLKTRLLALAHATEHREAIAALAPPPMPMAPPAEAAA